MNLGWRSFDGTGEIGLFSFVLIVYQLSESLLSVHVRMVAILSHSKAIDIAI